jgi:hypothetical protein
MSKGVAPAPLAGEGWGGGVAASGLPVWIPFPDPSPQGGGERKGKE